MRRGYIKRSSRKRVRSKVKLKKTNIPKKKKECSKY